VESYSVCLPAAIGQLTGLSSLSFEGRISGELPDSLSMLVGLESLVLDLDNPLLALSMGVTALTKLTHIVVPEGWLPGASPAVQGFMNSIQRHRRS
jgi:hypothetical protein